MPIGVVACTCAFSIKQLYTSKRGDKNIERGNGVKTNKQKKLLKTAVPFLHKELDLFSFSSTPFGVELQQDLVSLTTWSLEEVTWNNIDDKNLRQNVA